MIGATVRRQVLVLTTILGAGQAQATVCSSYDDCVKRQDEAVERKDFAAAQTAAEAALSFQQNPVLFVNLGSFHERQGHKAEALRYYMRYQESGDTTLTVDQCAEVARRVARLKEELAQPPPPALEKDRRDAPAPPLPAVEKERKDTPPPPYPLPSPSWRRGAGIGVGASGLVLTATGATLLALDKRYGAADANGAPCAGSDAVRDCNFLYRTQAPGIALLAVGGAALVGGIILFAVDMRRKKSETRVVLRVESSARGGELLKDVWVKLAIEWADWRRQGRSWR